MDKQKFTPLALLAYLGFDQVKDLASLGYDKGSTWVVAPWALDAMSVIGFLAVAVAAVVVYIRKNSP